MNPLLPDKSMILEIPLLPDYDEFINKLIDMGYEEEYLLGNSFDANFVRSLMESGFLVMSLQAQPPLLLPKFHQERSFLFFKDLHIPQSIRSRLYKYTLKPFHTLTPIMDACVEAHGDDWLTRPLVNVFSELEWNPNESAAGDPGLGGSSRAFCTAFGLYRDSRLVAGEFGVCCGGVYTSYSGFYREDSAGTVQMVRTAQFLESSGFAFWDLGMPMEYKSRLGAVSLARPHFIRLFREARLVRPRLSV